MFYVFVLVLTRKFIGKFYYMTINAASHLIYVKYFIISPLVKLSLVDKRKKSNAIRNMKFSKYKRFLYQIKLRKQGKSVSNINNYHLCFLFYQTFAFYVFRLKEKWPEINFTQCRLTFSLGYDTTFIRIKMSTTINMLLFSVTTSEQLKAIKSFYVMPSKRECMMLVHKFLW